jgi:hypothetical protein
MRLSRSGFSSSHSSFSSLDDFSPGASFSGAGDIALPDGLIEDFHPPFLLHGAVGIEVDNLAVGESDAEALFNEHVAFLLFGKR